MSTPLSAICVKAYEEFSKYSKLQSGPVHLILYMMGRAIRKYRVPHMPSVPTTFSGSK